MGSAQTRKLPKKLDQNFHTWGAVQTLAVLRSSPQNNDKKLTLNVSNSLKGVRGKAFFSRKFSPQKKYGVNMFLHVGNNKNILIERVVGIFDMDNATLSSVTRKFLSQNEKAGLSVSADLDELPKSFILYIDIDNQYKIC